LSPLFRLPELGPISERQLAAVVSIITLRSALAILLEKYQVPIPMIIGYHTSKMDVEFRK
jgi:hypothetical protein